MGEKKNQHFDNTTFKHNQTLKVMEVSWSSAVCAKELKYKFDGLMFLCYKLSLCIPDTYLKHSFLVACDSL